MSCYSVNVSFKKKDMTVQNVPRDSPSLNEYPLPLPVLAESKNHFPSKASGFFYYHYLTLARFIEMRPENNI